MQRSYAAHDLQFETLDTIADVIGRHETRELLQSLVDSMDSVFADVGVARRAGNFADIARAAHRLAGGCGSLGALPLQEALRRLEKAALAQLPAQCDAELAGLPLLVGKLRAAVDFYAADELIAAG